MKRRSSSGGGGGSWLDTYADMVTLLLCFFVLLYSMSTVDAEKFAKIAEALSGKSIIYVEAKDPAQTDEDGVTGGFINVTSPSDESSDTEAPVDTGAGEGEGEGEGEGGGEGEGQIVAIEMIFNKISDYIEGEGLNASVSLYQGKDYAFIQFRDHVFFDGDSYYLRSAAYGLLDYIGEVIYDFREDIFDVRFFGHTSQVDPNVYPNPNTELDRRLSSNRADSVLIYIQRYLQNSKGIFYGKKMTSIGMGSYYLVSPVNNDAERAVNRRVEIMITQSENVSHNLEKIYSDLGLHLVGGN